MKHANIKHKTSLNVNKRYFCSYKDFIYCNDLFCNMVVKLDRYALFPTEIVIATNYCKSVYIFDTFHTYLIYVDTLVLIKQNIRNTY